MTRLPPLILSAPLGVPSLARPGSWQRLQDPRVPQYCTAYFRALPDGVLSVFVGREPLNRNGELRWHLSIAHPSRHPTWEEIRDARYDLVPDDVLMVMMLPPRQQYVNLHEHCFHLHEIHEEVPR